jgi:hypothetical protein
MDRTTRQALLVAGAFVLLVVMIAGAMGAYVYRAGMVVVQVTEAGPNGSDINIRVPGALICGALQVIPDEAFADAGEEIQQFGPLARACVEKLADLPDFVLVEVCDRHEHVKVAKQGNKLIVDVDSPGERVHVIVPLSIVRTAVKKIEGLSRV